MLSFNPQVAMALAASAAIALGVPVVLGLVAWRWFRAPAVGWLIGAGTFFVSQVVLRLPWQIAVGVWLQKTHASSTVMWSWLAVSAFTAALFEETGRFVAYRMLFKDRTARGAVMLGLGHGGLESMLLVGLTLTVNTLLYLALANGQSFGIPEAQRPMVVEQFNALTPLLALAGGVERLSSMAVHVGLSVLVLQVFRRGSKWWLGFAIAFHTLSNLVGVAAAKALGVWQGEGVIAVFALLALWWTVRFVKQDSSFERSRLVRFPMTVGTSVKWISVVALVVGVVTLPIPMLVAMQPSVPAPIAWVSALPSVLVPVVLLVTVLWSPRAVRLEADALVVERRGWSDLRIPLADVAAVVPGPELKAFGSQVTRIAGNGGLMGFTGLYRVSGVGLVRCWATRLGAPTVLVTRKSERPVLLGVDDGAGLLQALSARV